VINNIFVFGRVVQFIVHTKFDDGRVDRKILSIFRTTRPEKNRKKGLAELVLAELSGNLFNIKNKIL
jgi:hypothetical protein